MKKSFYIIIVIVALIPSFSLGMVKDHDVPIVQIKEIINKTQFAVEVIKDEKTFSIKPHKTFNLQKRNNSKVMMKHQGVGIGSELVNAQPLKIYKDYKGKKKLQDADYLLLTFKKFPRIIRKNKIKEWEFQANLFECKGNYICKTPNNEAIYKRKYKFAVNTDNGLLDFYEFKIVLKGDNLEKSEVVLLNQTKFRANPKDFLIGKKTKENKSQVQSPKKIKSIKLARPQVSIKAYKKLDLPIAATPYEILGVCKSADQATIQNMYIKRIQQFQGHSKKEIQELLNWAYKSLRE